MSVQSAFRAGLLDAGTPVPEGLTDGADHPAGKRYDVYRNNVTHALIAALETAFPLVAKLIGDQNFAALAPLYVRNHPPTSPLMMFYGDEFPEFISAFQPLAEIGYLADAARLDYAMRQSYHAADAPALTPQDLAAMPEDLLAQSALSLAPATRIIRSDWPLFDIWRFNAAENAPQPRAVAQDVMVTRPEFDPSPHLLPHGAADWLALMTQGVGFEPAAEQTLKTHPDFDLTATLTLLLSTGALRRPKDDLNTRT